MRSIRALGCAIIGICVLFLLAFPYPGTAAVGVSLKTYKDDVEINQVEKGHEFLVRVYVSSATDLYGSAFDLVYDPQFLNVIDTKPDLSKVYPRTTEGDLLSEAGTAKTFLLAALEDNASGKVVVGISRTGATAGLDVGETPGLLLAVHFQAVATSEEATNIAFALQGLQNSELNDIAVDTWQSGGITVMDLIIRKLDLNDDGLIDMKDLILAMQVFTGQPPSQPVFTSADFSGDGVIGLSEAAGIMQVMGELRSPPED